MAGIPRRQGRAEPKVGPSDLSDTAADRPGAENTDTDAGGTGELIYSQQGTRRVTAARSEDGAPIPKGSEVMVMRYDKGVAYVRPWDDLVGDAERK